MAGMASVFKASLSTFFTSGELISSARRNHMSIDVLGNDINSAEMYLVNLPNPPPVVAANPPFYILPNMPITGAGPNDPQTSDQLFFYMDQPLPFQAILAPGGTNVSAAQLVVAQTKITNADNTFVILCPTLAYAYMVQAGQMFAFMDSYQTATISASPPPSVSTTPDSTTGWFPVTVVTVTNPTVAVTGNGGGGGVVQSTHISNSNILFITPAQMVRYSVQMVQLDPLNANGVPCLVRDQGLYSGTLFDTNFVATAPQEIITENLGQGTDGNKSGFKVYLSVNSGQAWEGLGQTGTYTSAATSFSTGWNQGIRTALDTQLSTTGRPGYQTTRFSEQWFRYIPTLVRVDLTTRTATQRSEYSATPTTAPAYKNFTESLVFVPAHSGLTMD
jgi:hypothetical protein